MLQTEPAHGDKHCGQGLGLGSGQGQSVISTHPHAATARFRLLSLAMRLLRRAISAPGVPIR